MTASTSQLLALIPGTHDFTLEKFQTHNNQTYAWFQGHCFRFDGKISSLKGFSGKPHLDATCTCRFKNPEGIDTLVLTEVDDPTFKPQWNKTAAYGWIEVPNPPREVYPSKAEETDDDGSESAGSGTKETKAEETDDDGSESAGSGTKETYDPATTKLELEPESTCNRSLALTILAVIGVAGVVFGALGLTQVMSMSTALAGSLTGVGGALVLAKLLDKTAECCNQESQFANDDML